MSTANPVHDLANERKKATFNSEDLEKLIYGHRFERRRYLANAIAQEKAFSKEDRYFLSREQEHNRALDHSLAFPLLIQKLGLTSLEDMRFLKQQIAEPGPLDLHFGMFIETIRTQATDEQQSKWLGDCMSLRMVGTYAQTELGHGTFLRGLETTATYDRQSQHFVINSPTLTSTKWWPGGLGVTANHVVLMARLIIDGKNYGPHAFLVQIRSLENHHPLANVTVGDIGPKFGWNSIDNGFLRFNNVRIPRENMLMKYAKVAADGTYTSPPHPKLNYGTMVSVRASIVADSFSALAKAATIAIRYNAVRRQTTLEEGKLETQIIDYPTQQYHLFPLLALAYSLFFTGNYMKQLYTQFIKSRDSGDFSELPQVHATSAGLKAVTSWLASDGIELCRKCCGGAGYLQASGLPRLFATYVPTATFEGDNNVMALQTSRYLMKTMNQKLSGQQMTGTMKYFDYVSSSSSKCPATKEEDFLNEKLQVEIYGRRAAVVSHSAYTQFQENLKRDNIQNEDTREGHAQQRASIELLRASKAHCMYVLMKNFAEGVAATVADAAIPPPVKEVLVQVRNLFALSYIEKESGEFLESGFLNTEQLGLIRRQQRKLLGVIRPNAVALVDSFGFTDYLLESAIGRADGDVYRSLFESANSPHNPLNSSKQRERTLDELKRFQSQESILNPRDTPSKL